MIVDSPCLRVHLSLGSLPFQLAAIRGSLTSLGKLSSGL